MLIAQIIILYICIDLLFNLVNANIKLLYVEDLLLSAVAFLYNS